MGSGLGRGLLDGWLWTALMTNAFALFVLGLLSLLANPAKADLAIFVGGDWALINIPANPRASLILIPGGDGARARPRMWCRRRGGGVGRKEPVGRLESNAA